MRVLWRRRPRQRPRRLTLKLRQRRQLRLLRPRRSLRRSRILRTTFPGRSGAGCGNRAGWADLDHVVAHAVGGASDCANLCCLCRRHHRLKTHARDWCYVMTPDGVVTVTTPSGVTRVSRPPGMRADDDGVLHVTAERDAQPDDPPPF